MMDTSIESLRTILHPRSVAIVGASDRPGRHGYRVVQRLLASGYEGEIYPINPRGGEVLGLPIYRSLADVPGPVDLIKSVTNIEVMREIMEVAPSLGTKGVIIYASGFDAAGDHGPQLQAEVLAAARAANIRLIGPNTMGVYCAESRLCTIGSPLSIPDGPIGLISQSGNVGITAMVEAAVHGTGLSHFLGIGLQLDVGLHDCIRYLASDERARVIAIYAEGIPDGPAFLDALRDATSVKPVVMFKAGATRAGARAAASHSGSLAVEDRVFMAACQRTGVVRVERSDELLPVALALATQPPAAGRRVALLGSGGGHTVQMGDAAERFGLEVPPLSPQTADALRSLVPDFGSVGNPSDFAGGLPEVGYPRVYAEAAELGVRDPDFDGVIMFGMFGGWQSEEYEAGYIDAAERIGNSIRAHQKPVIMHTIFAEEPHAGVKALQQHGIPTVKSIEVAARCFAALAERGAALQRIGRELTVPPKPGARERAHAIISTALDSGRTALLESEAMAVLDAYGIPTVAHRVVASATELERAALELGFPLAVKVHSSRFLHKSDAGGVHLDIRTVEEARSAFQSLMDLAAGDPQAGVIVARMVEPRAPELLVGMWRDPNFGPVIMLGAGGILVETIKDVAVRIPPIHHGDVEEMVAELKTRKLFEGFRGLPPVNLDALTRVILSIQLLAQECPEIAEVDINPLFAVDGTVVAADSRMVIEQPGTE